MKKMFSIIIILGFAFHSIAQEKYFSKNAVVSFFSKAPIENIEAINNKLLSVWNTNTGELEFSVLMKGFVFKKALMQEHFNENYVESDKYPKSNFRGTIIDAQKIGFGRDGTYPITVNGVLTLHGVSKPLVIPAKINIKNNVMSASSSFTIDLSDFNIKIPGIVKDNISNRILINVTVPEFNPLGQ